MGIKNLHGMSFGELTVIFQSISDSNGNAKWKCICKCGKEIVVLGFRLRNGEVKSCGCLLDYEKHGKSSTPEYSAWEHIKERCSKEKFTRYYGRGITVCDRWKNSFIAFYEDVGPRPSNKHSIERINNDLGYSPENCKWATDEEQCNNTCKTDNITAFGKTMSLSRWSRHIGIPDSTLWNRLYRANMSPEQALVKEKLSTKNHKYR